MWYEAVNLVIPIRPEEDFAVVCQSLFILPFPFTLSSNSLKSTYIHLSSYWVLEITGSMYKFNRRAT
jgi:hypothetical protein